MSSVKAVGSGRVRRFADRAFQPRSGGHHGVVLKLADKRGFVFDAGQRVIRGAIQRHRLGKERRIVQAGYPIGIKADAEVIAPFQCPALLIGRTGFLEPEDDLVFPPLKPLDRVGQFQGGIGCHICLQADLYLSNQAVLQSSGGEIEVAESPEHVLRGIIDGTALFGDPETGSPAVAQRHAQLFLQFLHLDADCRGRRSQDCLRRRKPAAIDNRHEDAKFAN